MINKKNLLGKTPETLGVKDAIHTAIVSVRAGGPIKPGQRCGMNKDREAVADNDGCGVADPFLKKPITTGDSFWMLLNQDAVPNVQHVWDHPDVDFSPPTREVKRNRAIEETAKAFAVTYEQLMEAAQNVYDNGGDPVEYPGILTPEQFEDVEWDYYDFWSEWSEETCNEFENEGSGCCPEYRYYQEIFEVP